MSIVLEINNPNLFEKELFAFVKQQKSELEEVTVEAVKNFLNIFQNREDSQDLSKFTKEIDEGLSSPILEQSHSEIFEELRKRYV